MAASMLQKLKILFCRVKYGQVILHSSIFEMILLGCMGLVASYLVYSGSVSVVDMIISDLMGVEYHSLPEEKEVISDPTDSPEVVKKKAFHKRLYNTGLTCFCALLIIGALALSVDSF